MRTLPLRQSRPIIPHAPPDPCPVPRRDQVVAAGITINALPILRNNDFRSNSGLVNLYKQNIIGGPNAFVMPAMDGPAFTDAILRKLILEIADTVPDTPMAMALLDQIP
jgi:hypothetical protein